MDFGLWRILDRAELRVTKVARAKLANCNDEEPLTYCRLCLLVYLRLEATGTASSNGASRLTVNLRCELVWCEERDLNPHALSGTSPSN